MQRSGAPLRLPSYWVPVVPKKKLLLLPLPLMRPRMQPLRWAMRRPTALLRLAMPQPKALPLLKRLRPMVRPLLKRPLLRSSKLRLQLA